MGAESVCLLVAIVALRVVASSWLGFEGIQMGGGVAVGCSVVRIEIAAVVDIAMFNPLAFTR